MPLSRRALALLLVLAAGCSATSSASEPPTTTTTAEEVRTADWYLIPPLCAELGEEVPCPADTTTTTSTTTTAPPTTTTAPRSVTTTTVSTPPTTETPPPTVATSTPPSPERGTGETRTTSSTNYCLRGTMANGEQVHHGAVAVNSSEWPARKGEVWTVLDGPLAGNTYTVKDHGPKAHFDVWVPSCDQARAYGRRTITIRRAG
jgi:3D (Asp-Asp-Asp) domain-containing protein